LTEEKKKKLERLKHKAKVAKQKVLQSKHLLQKESRKKARAKVTITFSFTSSRNFDNRKIKLHLPTVQEEDASRERKSCGGRWKDHDLSFTKSKGKGDARLGRLGGASMMHIIDQGQSTMPQLILL
jgi:hypothetical protein